MSQEELDRNVLNLNTAKALASNKPVITWLGHASFLVFWVGKTLLIDPVFSDRIGGMPRRIKLSKEVYNLTPDAVLISHGHMDHLDKNTLKRFPQATIILPRKSEKFLGREIKNTIVPLKENATLAFGPLTIKTVPARHGGWRYPWQKGYLAVGFIISHAESCIFYAGDTAFGDHFKEIGDEHAVNTALLPIGAYSPRWFLKSRHLNPPEAVAAAKLLKAKTVIPFHFGTYRFALDTVESALPWFAKEATKNSIHWQLNYDHNLFKPN